jgi:hypothetical protein
MKSTIPSQDFGIGRQLLVALTMSAPGPCIPRIVDPLCTEARNLLPLTRSGTAGCVCGPGASLCIGPCSRLPLPRRQMVMCCLPISHVTLAPSVGLEENLGWLKICSTHRQWREFVNETEVGLGIPRPTSGHTVSNWGSVWAGLR